MIFEGPDNSKRGNYIVTDVRENLEENLGAHYKTGRKGGMNQISPYNRRKLTLQESQSP